MHSPHLSGRLRLLLALTALVVLLAACADDPLDEDPVADEPDDDEVDEPEEEGDEPDDGEVEPGDPDAVTVGSANFPESVMLASAYAMALEAEGFEVEERFNIGAREVYFPALQDGELDVLPEYTGSLLGFLHDGTELTDTDELVDALRDELEPDVQILEPSEAENRNGLIVTPETAEEHGLEVTSDLAPVADELVAGGAPEARERPDGLPGLEEVYGIEFSDYIDLDPGGPLTIEALEQGDIDVARLFTSQGVIAERDWVVLEDDGGLIPSENIVPVVRADVADDALVDTLNAISEALTLEELIEMNRRVEVDNDDPDLVAEDWLVEQGLIDG